MATYLTPGVYVEEVSSGSKPIEGVGTAVAAFVGVTAHAPADDPHDVTPRLITNWSEYTRLYGGFVDGAMLPHAVYGYFANGGGSCYIVRVPAANEAGDAAGSDDAGTATTALPAGSRPELETLHVHALGEGGPYDVVVEIPDTDDDKPATKFALKVLAGGRETETHENLTFGSGSRNVETVVNRESTIIRVEAPPQQGVAAAERVPAAGTYRLDPVAPEPSAIAPTAFEGAEEERSGIRGLVIAPDVTMVAVPDLVAAATTNGDVDLDLFKAVQTTLIDHCELTGRMAILDPPPGLRPQQVKQWRAETAMYDAKYATLYYPWLEVPNPAPNGNGRTSLRVPPCGHVAGIWARNDATRGVWKAPANEVVRGAVNVATAITSGEQEQLNPIGVNCIRAFGTRGIRVWGARTLSSDPEWRYVNVRRLFNFIEESILQGTQWIVFEPNDMALWQKVKRTINAFLIGLWRQGALLGATPAQAFYVKCDEETNPPESIDEGKLVVEIGIAPVKPAEFVIFRISQWQEGAEAIE